MGDEYDVFGIGNPFMDVIIPVTDEEISHIDFRKGTINFVDPDILFKLKNEFIHKDIKLEPGGSVANTISLIAKLGGKTFYSGKVGCDDLAVSYEKAMKDLGVHVELHKGNLMTATALTFITPDCERTFIENLGAAITYSKDDVNFDVLEKSKIFHVSAFFLEEPNLREASETAMKAARLSGIKVSIDCADAGLIDRCKDEIIRIIRYYADIVFANEEEAQALTAGKNPEEALERLALMTDIAIVKIGEKGSLVKSKGKVKKIPALKVNAIDTNGAGDTFSGGFLYGLSKGFNVEKSIKLGTLLASKVVQKYGARLDGELNIQELLNEVEKNGL